MKRPLQIDQDKPQAGRADRLANLPHLERKWCPEEEAMLAALRLVLGLPRRPVALEGERP